MSAVEQAVQNYWKASQRLRATKEETAREFIKTMVIKPVVATTDNHVEKELLTRLLSA